MADKHTGNVKRAYAKVGLITKLKYAGVSKDDLILLYKLHVRSCLEYVVVAWHSSLSSRQEAAIERCQAVCLRIILQDSYVSYPAALEMAGLETLANRRASRCLNLVKTVRNSRQTNVSSLRMKKQTRPCVTEKDTK